MQTFLLQLFRAMQNFKKNCESCSHERTVLLEILYGEKPHRDAAQRNRDVALNNCKKKDRQGSYRSFKGSINN